MATCLRVEAPVARLYRSFRSSLSDFLTGVPSSGKKHLENFSKIFSMAAWLGDLFATWFSHEKRMFCALRTVFKTFQFSLEHFWLFIVFLIRLSHILTMFHSQIHHFSSSSLLQTSRKGMGFLIFSKYSMFIVLDFLIFELMLSFEKLEFRILVWVYLTEFVKCTLLTLRIWCLIYMVLCTLLIF